MLSIDKKKCHKKPNACMPVDKPVMRGYSKLLVFLYMFELELIMASPVHYWKTVVILCYWEMSLT